MLFATNTTFTSCGMIPDAAKANSIVLPTWVEKDIPPEPGYTDLVQSLN